jgi:hypothetical protein
MIYTKDTCSLWKIPRGSLGRGLPSGESVCDLSLVRGIYPRRTLQLPGTPEERQEVIVIETPDTVRSGWLEPVCRLQVSHDLYVSIVRWGCTKPDLPPEHAQDHECEVLFLEHSKLVQAQSRVSLHRSR